MFADPQFRTLGMVQTLGSERGDVRYLAQPVTLPRTPSRIVWYPPQAGERTDEVLGVLGFDSSRVARQRAEKVI